MLENLINSHKEDIMKVLGDKFNIAKDQQDKAAETISDVLSGFVKKNSANSNLKDKLMDLFDSNTSNTSNPLFENISSILKNTFSKTTTLNGEQIGQVSSEGLDSIISVLNNGAFKNSDMGQVIGQIAGGNVSRGGIFGMAKNLFGSLLGKK